MSDKTPPSEPISDAEKFKPRNVQDGDMTDPKLMESRGKGPDTARGAEHHLQMKSMNRR